MKRRTDITHFRLEKDLATPVERFFRDRAFGFQKNEVAFYEHRMDLYGYSKDHDLTIAVELKLRKWSRAIEQALLYQLCCDYSYVALPYEAIRLVDLSLFHDYGLGLIAVEFDGCKEVVPAMQSEVIRRHYREAYVSLLLEENANGF
jgi:hypothetical protein